MKFAFIAKYRDIWPVAWLYEALGVSRSGFHAWLTRSPSDRVRTDEIVTVKVRASFVGSELVRQINHGWRSIAGFADPLPASA